MIVVADTSPPLHLARIGRLNLIPTVVDRVLVPRTVWGELVQAGTRPDVVAALESGAWIEVVESAVQSSVSERSPEWPAQERCLARTMVPRIESI